ncbi:MAG: pantetheine-phosphate adenylyltransferase [Proteobacteria bacterium]|nr:MAG: pantetheine-phosphate adenylyltransferase [Pseudomonadota bacterium]
MAIVAVYPGTFDPITNGHTDLIRRASCLFDGIVVVIAANPEKAPLFSLEERLSLAREVLADDNGVSVEGFDDLLINCVRRHGARVILRGLRAVSDFEYEFQMAGMNKRLGPEIETAFLPASERDTFISASLVKEIASLGGDVSEFVDPHVTAALADKMK